MSFATVGGERSRRRCRNVMPSTRMRQLFSRPRDHRRGDLSWVRWLCSSAIPLVSAGGCAAMRGARVQWRTEGQCAAEVPHPPVTSGHAGAERDVRQEPATSRATAATVRSVTRCEHQGQPRTQLPRPSNPSIPAPYDPISPSTRWLRPCNDGIGGVWSSGNRMVTFIQRTTTCLRLRSALWRQAMRERRS